MRWGQAVLWWVFACLDLYLQHLQAQLVTSSPGFNDRFLEAKMKLNFSLNHNARDSVHNFRIELVELWSENSSGKSDVLRCRGHMMLLSGDKVSKLTPNGLTLTSNLPIPRLFPHRQIRFFEYIEHQGQFYLLNCYTNNQCLLFSSMDIEFTYRHTISDSGVPIDAKFFIQRDSLFLLVLYQARDSYVSQSRLYRWHKTSLDDEVLETEMTSTARSLTVFPDQENIIIVLECVGDERIKFPSQVWLREPTGSMAKVHNLPTVRPLSITHFTQRGQHFLLVIQDNRKSAVFWWEGREFVFWIPVEEDLHQFKVSVSSVMGLPFMMFTNGGDLKIYFMTSVKLEKVFDQNIPLTTSPNTKNSIRNVYMYENKDVYMFIQGLDSNNITNKYLFKVKLENFEIHSSEKPGRRKGGLDLLLSSVDALREQGDSLAELMPRLLLTNRPTVTNTTIISRAAVVRNGNIARLFDSKYGVFKEKQNIRKALSIVQEEIDECHEKSKSIKYDQKRHLIFHKDVHFLRANINSLIASTVNGNIFKPESYLSLTLSQRLHEVHTNKLKVQWLVLTHIGNSSIKDLLPPEELNITLKTRGLEVKNVYTDDANDAVIGKLLISKAYKDGLHGVRNSDQESLTLHLSSDTVIDNLFVDNIKDVNIQELLNTLYIPYLNTTIKGDVTFNKGLRVDVLATKNLRNLYPIIQFDTDPVQIPQTPLTPLTPLNPIQVLPVEPHLHPFPQRPQAPTAYAPQFPYGVPNNFYHSNPFYAYPYIPAYQSSYYFPATGKRYARQLRENVRVITSKVKVFGNLKVKRIIFKNSSMHTKNGPVSTTVFSNTFWTKSSPQVLPHAVHIRKGLTLMNNLNGILSINGINTSHLYQISNLNREVNGTKIIDGNASIASIEHKKGTQGKHPKTINVKHLYTKYINGVPAGQLVSLHSLKDGKLKITTEKLAVKGDLSLNTVNNIHLKKKLDSAVITDEDTKLDELYMKTVSARSIIGIIEEGDQREEGVYRLKGDLHLHSLNVTSVNNKRVRLHLVANRKGNTVIHGKKTFKSQVQIKSNMKVKLINNKNISNLLSKSKNQVITGFYTISNAKFVSLSNVTSINGMDPNQLIYIDQSMVNISQDVFFNSIYVDGNITASFLGEGCQLPEVDSVGQVVFNEQILASQLNVSSAQWLSPGGKLSRLFNSAVTSDTNQTITGSVAFSRLVAKDIQVDSLKGRNISFIYEDSLMIGKENQVITGIKHFTGTIKCQNIEVKKGVRFSKLNELNINDIDKKLVRLKAEGHSGTGRVSGKKTFIAGFSAFNLTCEGGINGIRPEMLARDSGPTIPALEVHSLTVLEDLKAEFINGIHMESFFHDIIYLNSNKHQIIGDSILVKGNVTFKGSVNTNNINNISTDELVFTRSDKLSHIKGCKKFSSDLHLDANSTVNYLNGRHLAKTYNNSIKIHQNITINGSLDLFDVELTSVFANEYLAGKRKLFYLNKTLNP